MNHTDAELDETFLNWVKSQPHHLKDESKYYEAFMLGVDTYKDKIRKKREESLKISRKILEDAEKEREQLWLNALEYCKLSQEEEQNEKFTK